MKTHDIAKVLSSLAQALKSAPNQTLDDLVSGATAKNSIASEDIPMALSTLVALAEFDKRQWQGLIEEYRMPIEIRPRDASRDILGKILKFLEQNPTARKNLTQSANKPRADTSPELMRALQFLLKT